MKRWLTILLVVLALPRTASAHTTPALAQPGFVLERADLARFCVPRLIMPCRIVAAGRVPGPAGAPKLWFQKQQGAGEDEQTVAVFTARGDRHLVLAVATEGTAPLTLEPPQLIRSGKTWLLHLPGMVAAARRVNAGELYELEGGAWRLVDLEAWAGDPRFRDAV